MAEVDEESNGEVCLYWSVAEAFIKLIIKRKKSKRNQYWIASNVTICYAFHLCGTSACREVEPCLLSCISNPQPFGTAREGAAACAPFGPPTTNLYFLSQKFICKSFRSKCCTENCFQILYGKPCLVLKCMLRGKKIKVAWWDWTSARFWLTLFLPHLRTCSCVNASFSHIGAPGFENRCDT